MSKIHLIQGLSLQYLAKQLILKIVLLIIKLELQIKATYRREGFKYFFFPFCVSESKSLGNSIWRCLIYQAFQINVNAVFHIKKISLFSINDQIGVKWLTRLRLKFSHLSKLKFWHKFKDRVKSMCNCGTEIETTKHFFLASPIPCQWKT